MNIVITGASRGIGYETVKILSKNSDNRIVAVSRNEEKLNTLKAECLAENSRAQVTVIAYDLNSNNLKEELMPMISANIDYADVLINNAGSLINKPFENIKEEDINYIFNVNVFSTIRLIQAFIDYMNKNSTSHIVNISSMGGFQSSSKFPGLSIYSSSKAALANLSECLAEELKPKNISVNCLALGAVQTEMLNEAFPGYKAPLNASEIAEFIAYFSLSGHKFFNGKILPVSITTP